jgi:hypothetical protein
MSSFRRFTKSLTLMGRVTFVHATEAWFLLRCRSGDEFKVSIGTATVFSVLNNLDELNRDRVPHGP